MFFQHVHWRHLCTCLLPSGDRPSAPRLPGFRWLCLREGRHLLQELPPLTCTRSWATAACESAANPHYFSATSPPLMLGRERPSLWGFFFLLLFYAMIQRSAQRRWGGRLFVVAFVAAAAAAGRGCCICSSHSFALKGLWFVVLL